MDDEVKTVTKAVEYRLEQIEFQLGVLERQLHQAECGVIRAKPTIEQLRESVGILKELVDGAK